MKTIASWNVNGIRSASTKGLFEWLAAESADVVCLQETKADPSQLGKEFFEASDAAGSPYMAFWASAKRRGYSGVAIYARVAPRAVRFLGIEEFDEEGRYLEADFGDFSVASAYFPNSQEAGARLDYKLRFCAAMLEYCDSLRAKGRHLVLAGDYNIAHKPIDLARPEQNEGNPGYLPEERAWMDSFTGAGYVDSFRHLCPEPGHYSWWTYRVPSARTNNVGWRLDYHCIDPGFLPALVKAGIQSEVMGSDHCPVSLVLDV